MIHVTCYMLHGQLLTNHRNTVTMVTSQSSQHNYNVEMYYSSFTLLLLQLSSHCHSCLRGKVERGWSLHAPNNNNPSMKLLNQNSVTYITVFPHLSHTITLHTPFSLPASGLVSCFESAPSSASAAHSEPRLLLLLIESCCCCTSQYANF